MSDNALVKLDAAQHALAECKTVMEAKSIADVAEAARVYLERTNASAETVNRATEIRLLAERQMGEFLKVMPKNSGCAGNPGGRGAPVVQSPQVIAHTPRLRDMGISLQESSRAQKLADIPAPEFRDRIAVAKIEGKLSTAAVLQKSPIRRRAEEFNLAEWKRHSATMLDLRFRSVPQASRPAAVQYINDFIQRYLS